MVAGDNSIFSAADWNQELKEIKASLEAELLEQTIELGRNALQRAKSSAIFDAQKILALNNLTLLANAYYGYGDFCASIACAEEALGVIHALHNLKPEKKIDILMLLARTWAVNAQDAKYLEYAEEYFQKAQACILAEYGEQSDQWLNSSVEKCDLLYRPYQRFDEQEKIFRSIVTIASVMYAPEAEYLCWAREELAMTLYNMQNYEEAEDILRDLVMLRDKAATANPEALAHARTNLAFVMWGKGDLAEAEFELKEAEQIRKLAFGEESQEYACSVADLSRLCEAKGELKDAKVYFQKFYDIQRKLLVEPSDITSLLLDQGHFLVRIGERERASGSFVEALELCETSPAIDKHSIEEIINILVMLHEDLGNFVESQRYADKLHLNAEPKGSVAVRSQPAKFEQSVPVSAPAESAAADDKKEASTSEELLRELDQLIGLQGVKDSLRKYTRYLEFIKLRKERGLDSSQKLNLHSVFIGNPGSGKTTVAKKLGKIFASMGLLSKGHVHEVDRSHLVGEYLGQTAPKVKEAIKKARGGVLFIDEAYALHVEYAGSSDLGREVIEILLKEMSDGPGDLAVVVAGYPKEMEKFFQMNPGLRSRFNNWFEFIDYTPEELFEIAQRLAVKMGYTFEPSAEAFLRKQLLDAYRFGPVDLGNGRYVTSVLEDAQKNLAQRIMSGPSSVDQLNAESLSRIELADLEPIFARETRAAVQYKIDEDSLNSALSELHSFVGLESVKKEIDELVKIIRFQQASGQDTLKNISLHAVFSGSPGTGKTTVARLLGRIYCSLGLLQLGHVVEVDQEGLITDTIGGSAIKASECIMSALGGILFIDEAYALTPREDGRGGGKEVIETLLKRMEDLRGQFAVVAAGYTEPMKKFLDANPGLQSRFDRVINFADYTPAQLQQIVLNQLAEKKLMPDAEAGRELARYLEYIYRVRDKNFGNGRTARRIVETLMKCQMLRLSHVTAEKFNEALLQTITCEDIRAMIKKEGPDPVQTGVLRLELN